MTLTLAELGERLQTFRKTLGLKQKDVAESITAPQAAISRLEGGIGGSIDLLLDLFNFYGGHFYISSILTKDFEVIKKTDDTSQMNTLDGIAVERLKLMREDVDQQVTDIIEIIEKRAAN